LAEGEKKWDKHHQSPETDKPSVTHESRLKNNQQALETLKRIFARRDVEPAPSPTRKGQTPLAKPREVTDEVRDVAI
jgi:hypothetical protein